MEFTKKLQGTQDEAKDFFNYANVRSMEIQSGK